MSIVKQSKYIGNDIYRDVILKKNKLSINTYQICVDLNLEEELVSNYFLGKSKDNLFLGVELLNYLEKKENNL
jgi:hypothetical protein